MQFDNFNSRIFHHCKIVPIFPLPFFPLPHFKRPHAYVVDGQSYFMPTLPLVAKYLSVDKFGWTYFKPRPRIAVKDFQGVFDFELLKVNSDIWRRCSSCLCKISPAGTKYVLELEASVKGAITSKIKHATKLKTSAARLGQLLQPSLAFCFSLQPMTAYRTRRHWL